ncbi:MAG: glycoside hydrolase family 3 C-terminal domain-containing protein [Spirochaetia bacterium]|nr:glycoside hydrolase family 3 C-terminal domain-containing protein [Spirochaetia bacterium]
MFDRLQQRLFQYVLTHALGMYKDQPDVHDHDTQQEQRVAPKERAAHLVTQMTLEEKISYISGYDDLAVRGIDRLKIPTVYASDATSGVRCFDAATAYPAPVAMAASWDRELIREVGDAIGEEARAQGVSILLGPGVNIARVPTCGRNFEYLGEDPYLAGEMASSYIQGVQGRGVITTVKHFACNNSDYDRHKSDSVVDERTLHEIYLPAFKKAVLQGGSLGVMSAYNQINGTYASEHAYLLQEVLRGAWGFDGFVMSDWNSLYSTDGPVKNGLDLEMPGPKWLSSKRIHQALQQKRIAEADLDRMVFDLLYAFIRTGIFDRPAIDAQAQTRSKRHQHTVSRCADEAVVVLKNDNRLLPLNRYALERVAVIGPHGLLPNTGGGGSSYMLQRRRIHGIYDALRLNAVETEVVYIESISGLIDDQDIPYLAQADAVVIAAGFDRVTESEGYDRSYRLPHAQERLIEQAAAVNSRCIVVLHGGGDMECSSWVDTVGALLHVMYLGEQAGDAVARVIYGDVCPSGRLPFSMVRKYSDIEAARWYVRHPEHMNIMRVIGPQGNPKIRKVTPMPYNEQLMVGYRHLDTHGIEPLFPFGFGLSYTTFVISDGAVTGAGRHAEITFKVRNTGDTAGSEVIQLYVHDQEASVFRPEQELKGFVKVHLEPGEEIGSKITIDEDAFSYYDTVSHSWVVEPGIFELRLGTSSRDIIYTGTFTIE